MIKLVSSALLLFASSAFAIVDNQAVITVDGSISSPRGGCAVVESNLLLTFPEVFQSRATSSDSVDINIIDCGEGTTALASMTAPVAPGVVVLDNRMAMQIGDSDAEAIMTALAPAADGEEPTDAFTAPVVFDFTTTLSVSASLSADQTAGKVGAFDTDDTMFVVMGGSETPENIESLLPSDDIDSIAEFLGVAVGDLSMFAWAIPGDILVFTGETFVSAVGLVDEIVSPNVDNN